MATTAEETPLNDCFYLSDRKFLLFSVLFPGLNFPALLSSVDEKVPKLQISSSL